MRSIRFTYVGTDLNATGDEIRNQQTFPTNGDPGTHTNRGILRGRTSTESEVVNIGQLETFFYGHYTDGSPMNRCSTNQGTGATTCARLSPNVFPGNGDVEITHGTRLPKGYMGFVGRRKDPDCTSSCPWQATLWVLRFWAFGSDSFHWRVVDLDDEIYTPRRIAATEEGHIIILGDHNTASSSLQIWEIRL